MQKSKPGLQNQKAEVQMPAQETIGYWNYMNPAMKALVSWSSHELSQSADYRLSG